MPGTKGHSGGKRQGAGRKPTKRTKSVELSEENRRMLWVPPRFAHGFAVLSEDAEVLYKCTTLWHQPSDRSILWNDPAIGIDWGISDPTISAKDADGKPLNEAEIFDY